MAVKDNLRGAGSVDSSIINGIIQQYKVVSGGKISAGDFVEFVNSTEAAKIPVAVRKTKIGDIEKIENAVYTGEYEVSEGEFDSSSSINTEDEVRVIKLDTQRAFIAYKDPNNHSYGTAMVANISDNGTITYGNKYVFSSFNISDMSLILLDNDRVLIVYTDADNSYRSVATIVRISTNSVQISNSNIVCSSVTSFNKAVRINSNQVLVLFKDGLSNGHLASTVLTIGGDDSISSGSKLVLNSNTIYGLDATKLEDDKVIAVYSETTDYTGNIAILKITDGIVSIDSTVIMESNDNFDFGDRKQLSICAINNTTVALTYRFTEESESVEYGRLSTTIIKVIESNITFEDATIISENAADVETSTILTDDNTVMVTYLDYSNSAYSLISSSFKIYNNGIIDNNSFETRNVATDNVSTLDATYLGNNRTVVAMKIINDDNTSKFKAVSIGIKSVTEYSSYTSIVKDDTVFNYANGKNDYNGWANPPNFLGNPNRYIDCGDGKYNNQIKEMQAIQLTDDTIFLAYTRYGTDSATDLMKNNPLQGVCTLLYVAHPISEEECTQPDISIVYNLSYYDEETETTKYHTTDYWNFKDTVVSMIFDWNDVYSLCLEKISDDKVLIIYNTASRVKSDGTRRCLNKCKVITIEEYTHTQNFSGPVTYQDYNTGRASFAPIILNGGRPDSVLPESYVYGDGIFNNHTVYVKFGPYTIRDLPTEERNAYDLAIKIFSSKSKDFNIMYNSVTFDCDYYENKTLFDNHVIDITEMTVYENGAFLNSTPVSCPQEIIDIGRGCGDITPYGFAFEKFYAEGLSKYNITYNNGTSDVTENGITLTSNLVDEIKNSKTYNGNTIVKISFIGAHIPALFGTFRMRNKEEVLYTLENKKMVNGYYILNLYIRSSVSYTKYDTSSITDKDNTIMSKRLTEGDAHIFRDVNSTEDDVYNEVKFFKQSLSADYNNKMTTVGKKINRFLVAYWAKNKDGSDKWRVYLNAINVDSDDKITVSKDFVLGNSSLYDSTYDHKNISSLSLINLSYYRYLLTFGFKQHGTTFGVVIESRNDTVKFLSYNIAGTTEKYNSIYTPLSEVYETYLTPFNSNCAFYCISGGCVPTDDSTVSSYNINNDTLDYNYPKINEIKTGTTIECTASKSILVNLPPGKYKLECIGAQGGSINAGGISLKGGKGGYATGVLTLDSITPIYLRAGRKGTYNSETNKGPIIKGGFNGGGTANRPSNTSSTIYVCSGGGASDIRIGTDSIYSRVIVAGGGGGAYGDTDSRVQLFYHYKEVTENKTIYVDGVAKSMKPMDIITTYHDDANEYSIETETEDGQVDSSYVSTQVQLTFDELYSIITKMKYNDLPIINMALKVMKYEGVKIDDNHEGGAGGGEIGLGTDNMGGTQTSPGKISVEDGLYGRNGLFGSGKINPRSDKYAYSGGGGGWYGGATSNRGGGGGSGYTYTMKTANNYPSGCNLDESYYLADTLIQDGDTRSSEVSTSFEDGKIIITVLDVSLTKSAILYSTMLKINSNNAITQNQSQILDIVEYKDKYKDVFDNYLKGTIRQISTVKLNAIVSSLLVTYSRLSDKYNDQDDRIQYRYAVCPGTYKYNKSTDTVPVYSFDSPTFKVSNNLSYSTRDCLKNNTFPLYNNGRIISITTYTKAGYSNTSSAELVNCRENNSVFEYFDVYAYNLEKIYDKSVDSYTVTTSTTKKITTISEEDDTSSILYATGTKIDDSRLLLLETLDSNGIYSAIYSITIIDSLNNTIERYTLPKTFTTVRANDLDAVMVNDTQVLITFNLHNTSAGNSYSIAGTVNDDNTITFGSILEFTEPEQYKLEATVLGGNNVLVMSGNKLKLLYIDNENNVTVIDTLTIADDENGHGGLEDGKCTPKSMSILDDNRVLLTYIESNKTFCAVLNIVGNTISMGLRKQIDISPVQNGNTSINSVSLSGNRVLISYISNVDFAGVINACVILVTDNNISMGEIVQVATDIETSQNVNLHKVLDNNVLSTFAVLDNINGVDTYVTNYTTLSIEDTTITVNTIRKSSIYTSLPFTNISSFGVNNIALYHKEDRDKNPSVSLLTNKVDFVTSYIQGSIDYTEIVDSGAVSPYTNFIKLDDNRIQNVNTIKLSDNKIFISYTDIDNNGVSVIATISDKLITYSEKVIFAVGNTDYISALALNNTTVLIAYTDTGNNNIAKYVIATVNGTSITYSDPVVRADSTYIYGNDTSSILMNTLSDGTNNIINVSKDGVCQLIKIGIDNIINFISLYTFDTNIEAKNVKVIKIAEDKILVVYKYESTVTNEDSSTSTIYNIKATIGTINSDNSISFSQGTIIESSNNDFDGNMSIAIIEDTSNRILLSVNKLGKLFVLSTVLDIVSVDISSTFNSASKYGTIIPLGENNRFVLLYTDGISGRATIIEVINSNIKFWSEYIFDNQSITDLDACYLGNNKIFITLDDYINGYYTALSNIISTSFETFTGIIEYTSNSLGNPNGIAKGSGTQGQDVEIYIPGNTV